MNADRKKPMIPFAPWCQPRFTRVNPRVEVATVYGYHYLAALLHLTFVKARAVLVTAEEPDDDD